MNFWVLLQGFGLGASMIIPIGAQNAYVLNQGIKRNHHLTTATICSLLDTLFISLGIFGGGAILSQNELLLTSVTLGVSPFLRFMGCYHCAVRSEHVLVMNQGVRYWLAVSAPLF